MTIVLKDCTDWNDFKQRVVHDQFADGRFLRGRFLFRGQAQESWPLTSTFDRWYKGVRSDKINVAERLLREFKDECEQTELPESLRSSELGWLGLAQHNGLPTRLLDWSESPYVAAFFAFSGHVREGINLEKKVAVWVLDSHASI